MKIKRPVFLRLTLAALITIPCSASSIVLGLTGNLEVGAMDSSQFINFGGFPVGPPYVSSPMYGTFAVTSPVTDIFASNGVTPGELGMIQSLDSKTTPVGVVLNPNPTTA